MNKTLLFTSLILILVIIFIMYTIVYIRFVRAQKSLIELEKSLLIERGAVDIAGMYPDITSSGLESGKSSQYLDLYEARHIQHDIIHEFAHDRRITFNKMSKFVLIAANVILLIAIIIA